MIESATILDETARWRARDVKYLRGTWGQLLSHVPRFRTASFRASDETPPNPYLMAVIREPTSLLEQPVPVGIVSNTYTLAQHTNVAKMCLEGIRHAGIEGEGLTCELGLTELGEWMNLRIYFPDNFNFIPGDRESLGLRVECFNSVDGSSRLVILLGWLRFVCSNGLVIGETKVELRDIHNQRMDLDRIPDIIRAGLEQVEQDRLRLEGWEQQPVDFTNLEAWVDAPLTKAWGKKAACRVFHVCHSGRDVKWTDPFAKGSATEKPITPLQAVPGAPVPAANLYDVSQALSFVASGRNNPDERLAWQSAIPALIDGLAVA
jgi:hypothetical protein